MRTAQSAGFCRPVGRFLQIGSRKPLTRPAVELVLFVSRERRRQHDKHQDIKRPPVRGGVGPSGSASPFFIAVRKVRISSHGPGLLFARMRNNLSINVSRDA